MKPDLSSPVRIEYVWADKARYRDVKARAFGWGLVVGVVIGVFIGAVAVGWLLEVWL